MPLRSVTNRSDSSSIVGATMNSGTIKKDQHAVCTKHVILTRLAADASACHGACKLGCEETSVGKRQAPRQARRG